MAQPDIHTKYFWVEITEDGKTINAAWATPEGYEHQDLALVHFYNFFSLQTDVRNFPAGPRFTLQKRYGVR